MSLFRALDRLRDRIHRARWAPERALAVRGEDLAMRYLQKQKYTIIERNYRPRKERQEVDIVAWEGAVLAFVEVKSRSSDETGTPDRAVNTEKQRHLIRAAEHFTRRTKIQFEAVRFDVVAVLDGKPPQIDLYRDAFRATVGSASRSTPYAPAPSNSYPPT